MVISLIAAASENNVIGVDGHLPWNLPDDMKFFRDVTKGHPVIMGRKTFESLGKALPNRLNVVVTRNPSYKAPGCTVVESLSEGIAAGFMDGAEEVFVIGGESLFREALPQADRIYLTRVHAEVEGDTMFPEFDMKDWKEIARKKHPKDSEHEHAFTYLTYERED